MKIFLTHCYNVWHHVVSICLESPHVTSVSAKPNLDLIRHHETTSSADTRVHVAEIRVREDDLTPATLERLRYKCCWTSLHLLQYIINIPVSQEIFLEARIYTLTLVA